MSKITPCLWFNSQAEEAAKFYVSVLPDSRIDKVQRSVMDYPGGKAGGGLYYVQQYLREQSRSVVS